MIALFPIKTLAFYTVFLLGYISCAGRLETEARRKDFFFKPKWFFQMYSDPLFETKPKDFAQPSLSEDGEFIVTGSKSGYIYLLNARSGRLLWSFKTDGAVYSKPLLKDGAVYAASTDGCVYALSSGGGKPLWKSPYCTGAAVMSEPVASEDMLFFLTNTNKLYAIRRDTGEFAWDYKRKLPDSFTILGVSTPVLFQGKVIAGFSDGFLSALKAGDGSEVWSKNLAEKKGSLFRDVDVRPVVKNGIIYTASFQGGMFAVDSVNGEIVWSREIRGISGLSICHDRIIYASSEGEIGALDFLNGEIRVRHTISRHISSAFVCSDDYLIAACESGIFITDYSLNPVAVLSFPFGISSQPAVLNGDLFFVSNGGYLHSFEFMN